MMRITPSRSSRYWTGGKTWVLSTKDIACKNGSKKLLLLLFNQREKTLQMFRALIVIIYHKESWSSKSFWDNSATLVYPFQQETDELVDGRKQSVVFAAQKQSSQSLIHTLLHFPPLHHSLVLWLHFLPQHLENTPKKLRKASKFLNKAIIFFYFHLLEIFLTYAMYLRRICSFSLGALP